MDFLWNIVLDTPCSDDGTMASNQQLVLTAQEMLISLYNHADPTNPTSKPHCADFVRYVTQSNLST